MTVLSDRSIHEALANGFIGIKPLGPNCVQPASVDVRLGRFIREFRSEHTYIDVQEAQPDLTERVDISGDSPYLLHPGDFILASTLERVEIPANLVARLEGKSSLGRVGLLIHSTAGYVDPGWQGELTLELSNVARLPILLRYEMKIAQISFLRLTTEADRPYGSPGLQSKYRGQAGPQASQMYREYEEGVDG